MSEETSVIELENCGPIEYIRFNCPPDRGGVRILTGTSGSGKSTALRALCGLLGVSSEVNAITPLDGEESGEARGLGRTVKIGKRTRVSGELEVPTLSGKLDIAKLVDPGVADKKARTKIRIRTLVAASGSTMSAKDLLGEKYAKFLSHIDVDACKRADDAVQMADLMKRQIDTVALEKEKEAAVQRKLSEAKALEAGDIDELQSAPDWNKAALEHRQAMQAVADIEAGLKSQADAQRINAESAAEVLELSAKLTQFGDAELLKKNIEQHESLIRGMERRLAEARLTLQQLKNDFDRAEEAKKSLAAAQARIKKVDTSYTQSDLDAAVKVREAKYAVLESIQTIGRRKAALEDSDKYRLEGEKIETEAIELRAAAQEIHVRLQSAIPVGPIEIDKSGELVVAHAKRKKKVPYDELSDGERWSIAIQYVVQLVGPGGVVAIEQEAWQALSPELRLHVRALCEQYKVYIVSAEVSDGPLRVTDYT